MKYEFSFFRCVEKIDENVGDFVRSVTSAWMVFICVENGMHRSTSYERVIGFLVVI